MLRAGSRSPYRYNETPCQRREHEGGQAYHRPVTLHRVADGREDDAPDGRRDEHDESGCENRLHEIAAVDGEPQPEPDCEQNSAHGGSETKKPSDTFLHLVWHPLAA